MSAALQPCLRPAKLPSLPSATASTTYICQSCRHARLLRRPKRPYTFTQLVTLSDGSAYTMRTTSPMPVYRSTRDTRNSPLWNPSSKELLNVEEDEAGRLAGFRARFGHAFDASKDPLLEEESSEKEAKVSKDSKAKQEPDSDYEFMDDDMNLLDLISSYGQEDASQSKPQGKKGGNSK